MSARRSKVPSRLLGVGAGFILILPLLGAGATPTLNAIPARLDPAVQPRVDQAYGKLPLTFEANRGQTDSQVKFLARSGRSTLFLTSSEALLVLTKAEARAKREKVPLPKPDLTPPEKVTRTVVRMKLVGANPEPRVEGRQELPGKVNYFIGNDPAKWRTNVPTYAKVQYTNVYPGVDLIYYGNQRQLEYDFVVRPGADPKAIALGFQGADRLEVDGQGDLVLHTAAGSIRQRKPVIYQEIDGARREIAGGYIIEAARQVSFRVAAYDASRPLIIDPALSYSTYLGGTSLDYAQGIAVDSAGNAYVAGFTASMDLPTTTGAFQPTLGASNNGGSFNAFVAKLNSTGSGLIYSTYLGGTGNYPGDRGYAIALDTSGNSYVTGSVTSTDFPTTPGAFQPTNSLGSVNHPKAFVTKLNSTGSALVYSTYLGGAASDSGVGIAVDTAGHAYVTGFTESADFPTTPGAFQPTLAGVNGDAFVTKLNVLGTGLVYSTYLGGTASNAGVGIAIDTTGNAYVTGNTQSTNFPTTIGAFQPTLAGSMNAFVTKLNALGTGLVYSTYLGGSAGDSGVGIAVDTASSAYVTGSTHSSDFPTTAGAFEATFVGAFGAEDAFVTKLNSTGSALVYSTYLGGTGQDHGQSIAVDSSGNAYVTGVTESTNFPTTPGAFQTTIGGSLQDAFVTKLNPLGTGLVYSSYLGGSGANDSGNGIAVDTLASPNAYVAGSTDSADFPVTPGAFQTALQTGADAFVAKIVPFNTSAGTNVSASAGNGVTVTFPAVVTPGDTGATTSNTGPTPPAGFAVGTPPTFYDVTTTATYVPPVSVCITYNPAQFGDPNSLRLFHFENNAWVDVTTSNDTTNHVICGRVSSLSPFGIFQKLPPADLAIGKSGASTVRSGANLTYGIGVVNLGPNNATGVVVTDHVPTGTTFVSAQFAIGSCTVSNGGVSCTVPQHGTPCAYNNGTVTCNIGALAVSSSSNPVGAGIQLVVHVTASRGATITNTASVSESNPDPNTANNSATTTTSVR